MVPIGIFQLNYSVKLDGYSMEEQPDVWRLWMSETIGACMLLLAFMEVPPGDHRNPLSLILSHHT